VDTGGPLPGQGMGRGGSAPGHDVGWGQGTERVPSQPGGGMWRPLKLQARQGFNPQAVEVGLQEKFGT
jgi:hypothetical protein